MKKIFSTLLALLACASLCFAADTNPSASGSCGTNLSWSLENHVLTISGTGTTMDDYTAGDNDAHRAPWYKYNNSTDVRHAIQSIVFPSGLEHIGNQAFLGCDSLRSVTIPASVTTIGAQAFQGCTALTSVEILGATNINGTSAFASCTKLTSVSMPYVTGIAGSAFSGCTALTSVTIPDSVKTISSNLFTGCSNLKSVTLPNITAIQNNAFKNCTSLDRITYNYTGTSVVVPSSNYDENNAYYAFYGVPEGATLFMPGNAAALSAFENEVRWNKVFKHFYAHESEVELDETSNDPSVLLASADALESKLASLNDGSLIDITFKGRAFLRNGDYNTLCLPFNLSAEQLADPENPLYNFSFYEITDMYKEGSFLKFRVNQASSVVAGKPYIMKYNGEEANLSDPTFKYVTVTASAGDETVVPGLVKMVGILKPTAIAENENTLFLLSGNRLAWANPGQNTMKGFRAYFEVLVTDHSPYYIPNFRSLKPSLVDQTETPTAIEIVENDETATKVIENGTMYIIKNGVKYNVQGQVISK